jgi:putative transposase
LEWDGDEQSGPMAVLVLSIFRFVRFLLSGHEAVAIENAALRLQLAAFQRTRKRPFLTTFDRLFWVGLSRVWRGWRGPLQYVQPDTVIRWQRQRFRRFWARLSGRSAVGEAGHGGRDSQVG